MTAVTEALNPRSVLIAPERPDTGSYVDSLRSSAGFPLSRLDWLGEKFFGVSVIKSCVQPFTGDWARVEVAALGWERIEVALDATADNVEFGWRGLSASWQGPAATACGVRLLDIARLHRDQADGASMVAEQLRGLVDLAKVAGEVLAMGLSVVNDILLKLSTPFGALKGVMRAKKDAGRFITTVRKILKAIKAVVDFVKKVNAFIGTIKKLLGLATKLARTVTHAAHVQSGLLMDDVAHSKFQG